MPAVDRDVDERELDGALPVAGGRDDRGRSAAQQQALDRDRTVGRQLEERLPFTAHELAGVRAEADDARVVRQPHRERVAAVAAVATEPETDPGTPLRFLRTPFERAAQRRERPLRRPVAGRVAAVGLADVHFHGRGRRRRFPAVALHARNHERESEGGGAHRHGESSTARRDSTGPWWPGRSLTSRTNRIRNGPSRRCAAPNSAAARSRWCSAGRAA
jgi:hypothetical protein